MSYFVEIGAAPANAECAQLGQTRDFERINSLEVKLYAAALQARYGVPPAGCALKSVVNRHDFGNYLTLAVRVDEQVDGSPSVRQYLDRVEDGLASWIEAGFGPPIEYQHDGIASTGGRTFEDIVMGALRTTRPDPSGVFPLADFEVLHTNLTMAFPTLAAEVRQQLEFAL